MPAQVDGPPLTPTATEAAATSLCAGEHKLDQTASAGAVVAAAPEQPKPKDKWDKADIVSASCSEPS
jgi:hypothetical protein